MPQAIWNNIILAKSDDTEFVEGKHYFPPDTVRKEYLQPAQYQTVCPWKGVASYYTLIVDGAINLNAAWTYLHPKPAAQHITGYAAFWKGVRIMP